MMDEINNIQLYQMFRDCKWNQFSKEPDFDKVLQLVSSKLKVKPSEKLAADIRSEYVRYKTLQSKMQSMHSSERKPDGFSCLRRENYVEKPKRPLHEVGDRQQRRRLSTFVQDTTSRAAEENTSPLKLYAYGLKTKYLDNKQVAEVGKQIFEDQKLSVSHVPLQTALAIFESGRMTKRIYIEIRHLFKTAGVDVLPTYGELDKYRKQFRPQVLDLSDGYVGVRFDYAEASKLTATRLFDSINLPLLQHLNEVHITLHDGLDGSGGHSVFNQRGSSETHNIIMYMFRVENLKTSDDTVIYENPSHASSSSCRPIMLLMGKESSQNCRIVAELQKERKGHEFVIHHCDKSIQVKVDATMSMVDGKLHSLLSGCGGAFCCLCTNSQAECNDIERIKAGFLIDRTLDQTLEICEKNLHLSKNRKTGDCNVRKGVTQQPITIEDISNLHPLHNILRCFGWIYKICYHATASHYTWSEAKLSVANHVGTALDILKQAKDQIEQTIKAETSILNEKPDPTRHGGTSTTGNIVKAILNTNYRALLTKGIDDVDLRSKIDEIILNMAVILAVINSSRKVKVCEYREFCLGTSLLIKSIPWIQITPSAHVVLAHSSELIDANSQTGLLNFTESGLEANNKFLRQYRVNFARKTNQFDNLSDCINRLWDKSDPMVMKLREHLHCSHCKASDHTIRSCKELKKAIHECRSHFDDLLAMLTISDI